MFKINYSGVMSSVIGEENGLTDREVKYYAENFENIYKDFIMEKNNYGFVRILDDSDIIKKSDEFYNKNKHFKDIVVLGIGGSALGLNAILNLYRFSNKRRRFYIIDNVDPLHLSYVFGKINLRETLFFVISKSGETVETLSQFLYTYNMLQKNNLDPKRHFVFVTDPEKGFLREISKKEGITNFDVPKDLGGRFSVLSYVGILPAFFLDEDISELIEGAKIVEKKILEICLFSNILYLLNIRRGKSNLVLFHYGERLEKLCQWFSQLWAESLGKKYGRNGEILMTGQTPIIAKGVTDQHSQLQLYLEGPKDKVVIMIKSDDKINLQIPEVFSNYDSVSYLCGKSFDELFEAEFTGTYGALMKESVPTINIEIEKLNLKTLGALFYFFELATAYSGKLYNVNPFDQPGVEIGKRIAFSILGKKGCYEKLNLKEDIIKKYERSIN